MATLVPMTTLRDSESILVNMDLVQYIKPLPDGGSRVYFESGQDSQSLPVSESLVDIQRVHELVRTRK